MPVLDSPRATSSGLLADFWPGDVDAIAMLARDYRPLALLERDACSATVLAEQIRVGRRPVRIRLFPRLARHCPEFSGHLQRALRALAPLKHPNVAAIYESGEQPDGTGYVVMEYVDGESATAQLEKAGPLSLPAVVDIVTQCAGALDLARQLGIRPRPLRLGSIILNRDTDGMLQVKMSDFGLPAAVELQPTSEHRGGQVDRRSQDDTAAHEDIRSLAAAAYAMLAGDASLVSAFGERVGQADGLPTSNGRRPELPEGVEVLLLEALKSDKEPRQHTAAEFAAALQRAAAGSREMTPGLPDVAHPPSAPIPPWRARRPSLPSLTESLAHPLFATFAVADQHPGDSSVPTPPARDATAPVAHARPYRTPRRRLLGELLLAEGLISQSQLDAGLWLQADRRRETPLGQILLEEGIITRPQLTGVLSKYHKKYRLGDLLVETNTITEEQLAVALREQANTGLRLGEVLQRLDYLSEQALREALCKQLSIGFRRLEGVRGDRRLADLVPKDYAREHRVVPIAKSDNRLTVAVDDPTDTDVVEDLQRQTGLDIEVVTSTYAGFWQAFSWLYEGDRTAPAHEHADPGTIPPLDSTARGERPGSAVPSPPADLPTPALPGGVTPDGAPVPSQAGEELRERYAALAREHEVTLVALREQSELCQRLLEERHELVERVERLAEGQRKPLDARLSGDPGA